MQGCDIAAALGPWKDFRARGPPLPRSSRSAADETMASSAGELEGAFAGLQLGAGHPPPPARGRGGGGGSAQGVAPHVLAVPRSAAARGAASTAPSFRSVPSAVFGGGFDTSSSSSVDGGSSVGAAAPPTGRAAPASGRHNVGRIPELDYFARKLARKDSPEWKLPYGKAGDVAPGGLPDVHASQAAYLSAMQAHTALEFQVGVQGGAMPAVGELECRNRQHSIIALTRLLRPAVPQAAAASAVASAEGKHPLPEQKWWPFEKAAKGSAWVARPVPGRQPAALDFSDDGDPWGKHLVHVSGRCAWLDRTRRVGGGLQRTRWRVMRVQTLQRSCPASLLLCPAGPGRRLVPCRAQGLAGPQLTGRHPRAAAHSGGRRRRPGRHRAHAQPGIPGQLPSGLRQRAGGEVRCAGGMR